MVPKQYRPIISGQDGPAGKVRLWANIPEDQRATDADLVEASLINERGEKWLQKYRELIAHPQCKAATKRGRQWPWLPCAIAPAAGEELCQHHGGAKEYDPVRRLKIKTIMRMRRDASHLERRAMDFLARVRALEGMAEALEGEMEEKDGGPA